MARKRLVGPSVRQTPRLDGELADRHGNDLDDHDVLEEIRWDDGAPAPGSIAASWWTAI